MVPASLPRSLRAACILSLAAVGVLFLTGCGGGLGAGTSTSTPSPYDMTHPRIVATRSGHPDALYIPDPIRVHVGQTVTWTNRDSDPHDVTADDGSFYSGPIGQDGVYRWTATRPGTFAYTCTIHPDMHGTIIVSPAH